MFVCSFIVCELIVFSFSSLELARWFRLSDPDFLESLDDVPDIVFAVTKVEEPWELGDVSSLGDCGDLIRGSDVYLFDVFVRSLDLEYWKSLRILSRRHKLLVDVCICFCGCFL